MAISDFLLAIALIALWMGLMLFLPLCALYAIPVLIGLLVWLIVKNMD